MFSTLTERFAKLFGTTQSSSPRKGFACRPQVEGLEDLARRRRPATKKLWAGRFLPNVDALSERIVPAVTARYHPAANTLVIAGDARDNIIIVSRNAVGNILVNGGGVGIQGGVANVRNTRVIQVLGQNGNDTVIFNDAPGALPPAVVLGGFGNDILIGGSGNDRLFGQAGNDTLFGRAGADFLNGGDNNDLLLGGDGDDLVFGDAGDDRMVYNPGDDTDVNEGGAGRDTLVVNGGNGAETFTVAPNGTRVTFRRTDLAPFAIDIGTSEALFVNANGGNDTFTAANGLAGLIEFSVDGGDGDDNLTGGDGDDRLDGGDGDDSVNGGRGVDRVRLGSGADIFTWNPGDGSDTVEGEGGLDTMIFNGSADNELVTVSDNNQRIRFTRDVGSVVLDVDDVERIDFNALGGADTITVNDLSGTDVTQFNLSLVSAQVPDGQSDRVIINGSDGFDRLTARALPQAIGYTVTTFRTVISVIGSEAIDSLALNGLGGNDIVDAAGLPAATAALILDGGADNDTVLGGLGNDILLGSDGDDIVIGGVGNDAAFLGAGNDTFVWDPGEGSDVVDGQAGRDTLLFRGNAAAEAFTAAPNGGRVRFTRNVGNVTMDLDNVEQIDLFALGGADSVTVSDLTGTDLDTLNANLNNGANGDGAADTVVLNGTNNRDVIDLSLILSGVQVTGLGGTVNIRSADPALDRLVVNAFGGNDLVDGQEIPAGRILFEANGGDDNDLLTGTGGNDVLRGEDGDDTLVGLGGQDSLIGGAGVDFIVQD